VACNVNPSSIATWAAPLALRSADIRAPRFIPVRSSLSCDRSLGPLDSPIFQRFPAGHCLRRLIRSHSRILRIVRGSRHQAIRVSHRPSEHILFCAATNTDWCLLLAAVAAPAPSIIEGRGSAACLTLRTFGYSKAIIDQGTTGKNGAVIGAGFIGLKGPQRSPRAGVSVIARNLAA